MNPERCGDLIPPLEVVALLLMLLVLLVLLVLLKLWHVVLPVQRIPQSVSRCTTISRGDAW